MKRTLEEKRQVLKDLETTRLSQTPSFNCYADGSGNYRLDDQIILQKDYLERLIKFCNEHNLSFQIFTKEIDSRVRDGYMQISLYEEVDEK